MKIRLNSSKKLMLRNNIFFNFIEYSGVESDHYIYYVTGKVSNPVFYRLSIYTLTRLTRYSGIPYTIPNDKT